MAAEKGTPSPQTLVCTQTESSFDRKLKQYHADREMLAELEALAAGNSPTGSPRKPVRRGVKKSRTR